MNERTDIIEFEVTDDKPALLCRVNNNTELTAVEALLRSYHIPIMKKWHNAGDVAIVYMATSFLGADIFVPSMLLEKARELLAAEAIADDSDNSLVSIDIDDHVEYAKLKEAYAKTARERARLMVFVFAFPIFFSFLALLLHLAGFL